MTRRRPNSKLLLWFAVAVTSACAGHVAGTGSTAAVPATARSRVTLEVEDRTPKFLSFYRAAHADSVSEPQRWALWQRLYGFAAVPPGAAGDSMARHLLADAWPRYPQVMSRIHDDPPSIAAMARSMLDTLAPLLGVDRPLKIRLLIYVGGMEPNAFTFMLDSVPTVAVPVERPAEERMMLMTHELTHALNLPLARLPGGWERSIAQTVLTEGLAMRATQRVHSGRPDTDYIELRPGWLADARAHERAILAGIRPFLERRDGETVARFTFGSGTSGRDREAYYVGWRVVGYLLDHGTSFATLSHLREADMPALVDRTIGALLEEVPTKR